jgi:hypothetical protein
MWAARVGYEVRPIDGFGRVQSRIARQNDAFHEVRREQAQPPLGRTAKLSVRSGVSQESHWCGATRSLRGLAWTFSTRKRRLASSFVIAASCVRWAVRRGWADQSALHFCGSAEGLVAVNPASNCLLVIGHSCFWPEAGAAWQASVEHRQRYTSRGAAFLLNTILNYGYRSLGEFAASLVQQLS